MQDVPEWGFWLHELKTGFRCLIRRPSFSVPAIVTLALGIGATAAIFTVLYAVVLRPLPYPEPDRLVRLQSPVPGVGADAVWGLAKAEHLYFQSNASSFQALGLYVISRATLGTPGQQAEQIYFAEVSAGLPAVLGSQPPIGRPLEAVDNLQEKPAAVWLAHDFWRRRFGGDPAVVGRSIQLDGRSVQVAGVLAPGARLPEEEQISEIRVDAWTPLWLDPAQPPAPSHRFRGIGRLKPGVPLTAAQAELTGLTARLPDVLPGAYSQRFLHDTGFSTQILPLRDDVLGGHAKVLWTLFGSVALLLVIAGTNVANLFLAHGEARRRETALRAALGAAKARLARHFLVEALLIAAAAGALGVLLAVGGVRSLIVLSPTDLPRLSEVHFGWAGVGFIALVSLVVAGILGYLPLVRCDVKGTELCRAGRATISRRQHVARGIMVAAQCALSLVLLAGAALLVQSFHNLGAVEPGVKPDGVLTFRVVLPGDRYVSDKAVRAFYRALSSRLGSLSGVSDIGLATALPMTGYDGCSAFYPADHPPAGGEEPPCVPVYLVSRGYFRALGIGLQTSPASAGWDDAAEHSVTAIASKALAARFWRRGTAAFGKSVRGGNGRDSFQIAALADDVRANGCDRPATEALYLPLLADEPPRDVAVVVRTNAGAPEGIAPRIRRELAALDAQVAMTDVRSMAGIIASSKARITFSALLLGVASTLALLLTAIGIYSLLSYLVVHRRSEISIRLALGAQRGKVTQLVISHSLKFATAGLTLGLAAALFITRLLQSLLFEVSSTDPATLGFVSAVLLLLTVAASWVPVHRATRIPPCEALRHE